MTIMYSNPLTFEEVEMKKGLIALLSTIGILGFGCSVFSDAPRPPELISPKNGDTVYVKGVNSSDPVSFNWCSDEPMLGAVVEVSESRNFEPYVTHVEDCFFDHDWIDGTIKETPTEVTLPIKFHKEKDMPFYWRVWIMDTLGNWSDVSRVEKFYIED